MSVTNPSQSCYKVPLIKFCNTGSGLLQNSEKAKIKLQQACNTYNQL